MRTAVPLAMVFLGVAVLAQQPSQPPTEILRPIQSTRQFHPEFPILPPDTDIPDIGDLEWVVIHSKPPTLEFATFQSAFFTDNVRLTDQDRRSSWGWYGEVELAWVPYSTYRWRPRITVEQTWVRYDRSSSDDFDRQRLLLENRFHLVEDKSLWSDLSYNLSRFTYDEPGRGEDYKEGDLYLSLGWFHLLNQSANLGAYGHYRFAWHHTSPSDFDRIENELQLGLAWIPKTGWQASVYVEPLIAEYLNDTSAWTDRQDFNLLLGLSLYWTPIRHLSVGTEFGWFINDSTAPDEDYHAVIPLFSLQGNLRF